MATTSLPSPPPSPSAHESTHPPPLNADSDPDLTAKLDHLLANHLHLLDAYTTLRTQLSTDLSSAFFALASANRNAAALLGPGRQFGRDQYDERMKSTLKVEVEQKELMLRDDIVDEESEEEGKGTQSGTKSSTAEEEKTQAKPDVGPDPPQPQPQPQSQKPTQSPPIPQPSTSLSHLNFTINPSPSSTATTKPRNPLHQFHPLPPPSLRQTQSVFTQSVSTTIPSLLTTMSRMKMVEREILRVRREMGMVGEYKSGSEVETESEAKEEGEQEGEQEEEEVYEGTASTEKESEHGATKGTRAKQQSSSKSSVHNLVSRARPSEPRSRVLKVD